MNETWDVLVVDDEAVVRDAIRLVLGSEGWRVAVAASAEAGLAHTALDSCRLVFCDLMLPDRSGLDVVREMHRRRPGLPIVVITAYVTAENSAPALAAGATAFLAKPFDATELLNLTRHVLAPMDVAGEEGRP